MKFKSPDDLKNTIETIFKLKERGWGYRKIANYLNTNHMFVKRVLKHETPDKAFEHYVKYHFPDTEQQSESEAEDKTEKSVMASADRKILDEVRRYTRSLAVQQLKRVLEQGMVVDMLYEQIQKAREEKLKRELIWTKLKHEVLNEALIFYLTGKISKEKFARVVLATMFT